ncbi:g8470 [Coccomyxa viridis]|uniref:G8470 protein n=1 Tax=Coccomyxa viridis TaxID=1274662 RepID=A0ABP1G4J3_9CHLO
MHQSSKDGQGAQKERSPRTIERKDGEWRAGKTSADQHVDNMDPQIMEMALLDLPNIERVLQLRAPIETLQGAKALKLAYQIWMEEMRVHHDDPRAWEFQQNSQAYLEALYEFAEYVEKFKRYKEDFPMTADTWIISYQADINLKTICGDLPPTGPINMPAFELGSLQEYYKATRR